MDVEIVVDETPGGTMAPLFAKYGVTKCDVEGCPEPPSTMITNPDGLRGLCEKHFQEENLGNQDDQGPEKGENENG